MQIAVLDYSTTQVFIYNIEDNVYETSPLIAQLEDEGYDEDWASLDDNDIVEMWLAHVKHHDLDCIHYMTADALVLHTDFNATL